jgi:hypothetical protein
MKRWAMEDRKLVMLTIKTADEAERFYFAYAADREIEGSQDTGKGIVSFKGKVKSVQSMGPEGKRCWFVDIRE